MFSLLFKLAKESETAFRRTGDWQRVKHLNHCTGLGLWMFWGYFVYMAFFGLIILIWPSYPGLMLTDWIANELPYGVLSLTDRHLSIAHVPFSRSVVIHIVIWQTLTAIWLWVFTFLNARFVLGVCRRIDHHWQAVEPRNWSQGRLILSVFFSCLFGVICLLLFLTLPFFSWPVLMMAGLDTSAMSPFDLAGFIFWLGSPILFWQMPLVFLLISDVYLQQIFKKNR